MTTIRQIISDAYREGGLIQIGTLPEADQLDEGLRKLQSIVSEFFGHELGESLLTISYNRNDSNTNQYGKDVDSKEHVDSYFVPSNVRLLVFANSAQTVYLNPNPAPGARVSFVDVNRSFASNNFTVKANGRRIAGAFETVLNTNGENSEWFYRDDLGEWVKTANLDVDGQSPFPPEFDELLITSLAIRLNPRYEQKTAPETLQTWNRLKSQFRSRYKQTEFVPSEVTQLFRNHYGLDSSTIFNRGFLK